MTTRARRRLRAPGLRALVATLLLGVAPWTARAHMAGIAPTFGSLVADADRVLVVRVVDPARAVSVPAPGASPTGAAPAEGAAPDSDAEITSETRPAPGPQRAVVVATIVEVIGGGEQPGERIRFASHGHGVATYAAGDTALVFLERLRAGSELGRLRAAGIEWVSLQEHDSRFVVDDPTSDPRLDAARSYVAASALPAGERSRALGELTRSLLRSPDAGLAADAVRDLAVPRADPWLTAEQAPALLEQVVHAADRPISVRVGLLAVLDARHLVDASEEWVGLLRSARGDELTYVIRVAGRHPSPRTTAILVGMLARDSRVAESAALALADPRHAEAVPALEQALARDEPRVRGAVIRALGAIASRDALAALRRASETHPEPAVRRRASAELRRLGTPS